MKKGFHEKKLTAQVISAALNSSHQKGPLTRKSSLPGNGRHSGSTLTGEMTRSLGGNKGGREEMQGK